MLNFKLENLHVHIIQFSSEYKLQTDNMCLGVHSWKYIATWTQFEADNNYEMAKQFNKHVLS